MSVYKTFENLCQLVWYFIQIYFIGIYILIKELFESLYIPSDEELLKGNGLVAIVTGGTEGIGLAVVKQLITRGVTVFIASLPGRKAEDVKEQLRKEFPAAKVHHLRLDLRSLKSVEDCVKEFNSYSTPLHILINNAGVMLTPHYITEDGYEEQFQVNYLSHYYLTSLLIDNLQLSSNSRRAGRIINVSSAAHTFGGNNLDKLMSRCPGMFEYSPHFSYATSKLAIIMSTYSIADQLKKDKINITVNSLHPGIVNSGLYKNVHWSIGWLMMLLAKFLFKSPQAASESVIYVAMAKKLEGVSGHYYDNCQEVQSNRLSYNINLQQELEKRTRSLLSKRL